MRTRWVFGLATLLLLALVACEDATGVADVDHIDVGPSNAVVQVGDSIELVAVARSRGGDVVAGPMTWRSLQPSIATVRANGGTAVIVGHAAGTAEIEVESRGKSTTVAVVVEEVEVGSVDVLPGTIVLEVGQQISVEAQVRSTTGEVVTGRTIAWSVEPQGAATVTPQSNGRALVVALVEGEAVVRAVVDGASGQALIQVVAATPPPQNIASVVITPGDFSLPVNHETPLQAIAKQADGTIVNGRPVAWTVSAAAVADVTPIPGSSFASFRAKTAGTVTVRATIDGVYAEITVEVTAVAPPPQQVLYLMFRAPQRGIWRGQITSFAHELVAMGANGVIADPQVTWSVEDETILELDEQHGVKGLRSGTTKLIATSGTVRAELRVSVFEGADPAVYDLTYDWWDYEWHMAPQTGVEKWTDENGTEHDVAVYVTGGTLTLHGNGDYERVLKFEGWSSVSGQAHKVIEREEIDVGRATIEVGGESAYLLHSDTTEGLVYKVVGTNNAGNVRMRATIGTAPEYEYLFRMRQ